MCSSYKGLEVVHQVAGGCRDIIHDREHGFSAFCAAIMAFDWALASCDVSRLEVPNTVELVRAISRSSGAGEGDDKGLGNHGG